MKSFETVIEAFQHAHDKPENQQYKEVLAWYIKVFNALDKKSSSYDKLNPILKSLYEILQQETLEKSKLIKLKRELTTTLETEYQLVFKGHYLRKWMLYGMMFGIPIGVMFGIGFNDYAFSVIGIGFGFALGLPLGSEKEKKAATASLVLDLS